MDYKRMMWEQHHYRFGLAGEGQADVIQGLLEGHRGLVLNIGCGPWGDKVNSLAAHCDLLVAADKHPGATSIVRPRISRSNVRLLVADARALPFASRSFDHVLALGLLADIPDPSSVFVEFLRVCRPEAKIMVTNSVAHPKDKFLQLGLQAGLRLIGDHEGYCPAASGEVPRRYLLVFSASDGQHAP